MIRVTLVPVLFLSTLLVVPAFAGTYGRSGPLYLSSEAFQTAQTILVEDGYLRAGTYARAQLDEPTRTAIRAFQRDHFVRPNGLLDPETMAMLTSHHPPAHPPRRSPAEPDARTEREPATSPAAEDRTVSGSPAQGAHDGMRPRRAMPATASGVPFIAGLGSLLLAGGCVLLRRPRA